MGSCQSQQQKKSQIARVIKVDLQAVESNSKNNLHFKGDYNNQDFLQTEDLLYQEINVLPCDQFDLNNNITFEIKSLFQQVQISEKQQQKIPAVINLSTNGISFKQLRRGMDIICVIDISISMKGEKIQVLKQTLLKLLDQLEEKDRLSLLVFNDQIKLLAALKKMTLINKKIFQKFINDITATDGKNNIQDAFEKGLTQLKKRKQLNFVSSIFLISGGQNYHAKPTTPEFYQDSLTPFSLNCFSLGKDHNPTLLQKICSSYNGIYYNIGDIDNFDKYFQETLHRVMNSQSQQIEITFGCLANEIFDDEIEIKTIYSKKWRRIVKTKKYRLLLPMIELERSKSFVFKLQIPVLHKTTVEESKDVAIIFAYLQIPCPLTNQIFYKETALSLTIQPINAPELKSYQDADVALKYYKINSYEKMKKALQFCKLHRFYSAKCILNKAIAKINSDDAIVALCQEIISSLNKTISIVNEVQMNLYLLSQNNCKQEWFLEKSFGIEQKQQVLINRLEKNEQFCY